MWKPWIMRLRLFPAAKTRMESVWMGHGSGAGFPPFKSVAFALAPFLLFFSAEAAESCFAVPFQNHKFPGRLRIPAVCARFSTVSTGRGKTGVERRAAARRGF